MKNCSKIAKIDDSKNTKWNLFKNYPISVCMKVHWSCLLIDWLIDWLIDLIVRNSCLLVVSLHDYIFISGAAGCPTLHRSIHSSIHPLLSFPPVAFYKPLNRFDFLLRSENVRREWKWSIFKIYLWYIAFHANCYKRNQNIFASDKAKTI